MNKIIGLYLLFASAIVIALASCNIAISSVDSQTPTPLPPYLHYTPSKASNIHLEFDYASSWLFSQSKQEADFISIGLTDPQILALPTNPSNGCTADCRLYPPNDLGRINIWVLPSKVGETAKGTLEDLIKGYSSEPWRETLLDHYMISINGHDAGVLEYLLNDPTNYSSIMFNRRIVFVVDKQSYTILFERAEKDQGNDFEQGYEYFFKSLKIVP